MASQAPATARIPRKPVNSLSPERGLPSPSDDHAKDTTRLVAREDNQSDTTPAHSDQDSVIRLDNLTYSRIRTQDEDDGKPVSNTSPATTKSIWRQLAIWSPEIAWCIMSILLLVSIVIVLLFRDEKPLPDWPLGLTVNTVVALLATGCRATQVVPISEGIAQLKWNWLAKGQKPLMDLEVFNQASRGPWGSIRMVFTARGPVYAVVAAVVLITGLATSTLTQSSILFSTRMVQQEGYLATAQVLERIPPDVPDVDRNEDFAASYFADSVQQAAIQSIFSSPDDDWPTPLAPVCPSPLCRWPRLQSLAMCMTMRNATEQLGVHELTTGNGLRFPKVQLFGDVFLEHHGLADQINISSPKWYSEFLLDPDSDSPDEEMKRYWPQKRRTAAFNDETDLLNSTAFQAFLFYHHTNATRAPRRYRAVEMLFHYCVQTSTPAVEQGVFTTVLQNHTQIVSSQTGEWGDTGLYLNLTSKDGNQTLTVDHDLDWDDSLELLLRVSLAGDGRLLETYALNAINSMVLKRVYYNHKEGLPTEENDEALWNNIKTLGEAMALGMTNVMQRRGRHATGEALNPVTYITVRYQWLSFIATQVFLTIVFLGIVIVQTWRLGIDVVKSSDVAGLFAFDHSGNDKNLKDGPAIVTYGIREKLEREIVGTLRQKDGAWSINDIAILDQAQGKEQTRQWPFKRRKRVDEDEDA